MSRIPRVRAFVAPVVALAAAVGAAGCTSQSTASTTTTTTTVEETGAQDCAAAVAAAERFFETHPAGPGSLDARAADELSRLVAAVEGRCDIDEVMAFGPDLLEPWSARTTSSPAEAPAGSRDAAGG